MSRVLWFVAYCTAVYYLLARAEATRWFWEPLDHTPVGALLRCAACCGFWLGLALAAVFPPVPGVPWWLRLVQGGTLGLLGTGLSTGALEWALATAYIEEGARKTPQEDHHATQEKSPGRS